MSIRHLDELLEPRSIAVIGASNRPGNVGATVWRNLSAFRLPAGRGQPEAGDAQQRKLARRVADLNNSDMTHPLIAHSTPTPETPPSAPPEPPPPGEEDPSPAVEDPPAPVHHAPVEEPDAPSAPVR